MPPRLLKPILAATVVLAIFLPASPRQADKPKQPAQSSAAVSEALRLNNLGAAYMGQQRFSDALKMFQRARALDPHLDAAHLNEAIALLNEQKTTPAREELLAISRRDPQNARAWYNLGLLYKGTGQAQPALDAFRRAAQLAPQDADAQYFVGSMYAELQNTAESITAFRRALQLNPFHASAEFGLARIYQRTNNEAESRAHLSAFQRMTQAKLGAPISPAYGDQGPLSLAQEARVAHEQIAPAIKVAFTSVAGEIGVTPLVPNDGAVPEDRITAAAMCILDYDGDGSPDVYLGTASLYRNLGKGRFEDHSKTSNLPRGSNACAAGDFDNDGHTDLALAVGNKILLYRNQGDGSFKDVTQSTGMSGKTAIDGLTWFDFDHDGDIDLYVISSDKNILWRNNGNGTFTAWTAETGMAGEGPGASAVPTDVDSDRAIDLLVTGTNSELLLNPREGKWRAGPQLPRGTVGAAVLDFDKDSWMDLALTLDHAPGVQLLRSNSGKGFTPLVLPDFHWAHGWGVTAVDYDNDGWVDLAVVGETSDGHGELRILRNEGYSGFRDVSAAVAAKNIQLHRPRQVVAADFDADGDPDLFITQQSGPLVVLRNNGGNQNHSLRIALKGLNDNKSAIGSKVEVYAGDIYQKFELTGAALAGQSSTDLLVGIGKKQQADVVRVLWPTGVVQDEVEIAANKPATVTEIDRRGSSCPLLFAWDGRRYRFVTDMLGAGVLGHWVAPATRNIPDPTEYVKIAGFTPALRNRKLSFRFMEPMEEVVYVDQLRLLAIDHPAGVRVDPNEYFASNPPYPEFKVVASRSSRPVRAWDDHGREVTDLLRDLDHRYVSDLTRLPFAGFTVPHKLTLDLGERYNGGPLRLLMSGYIEYFTATSMYAADQARIQPFAPFVEAQGADGKWTRVLDDMGFPAGLPRTITVDLSGKLPIGARKIRLTTNLQIYWDQALVDRSSLDRRDVVIHDVPLSHASLRFHGYPQASEGSTPGDLTYTYEKTSATGPYSREVGAYTRPGDVTTLLRDVDDKLVIFGSGEELAVEFDPTRLSSPPSGWQRDYFFFADGYEKDMDFYAAEPNTVAPLPFRRMGVYPPAKPFPNDAEHLRYQLDYNTRFVTRPEPRSFRFGSSK